MWQSIQRNMAWRAIPIAALAAGTVFLIPILIFAPLFMQISPALFLRYMGSLVLGSNTLVDTGVLPIIIGLILHYALALFYTFIIAVVVHRWGLAVGIIGGGLLGLCFYAINLFTMTMIFPWFFAVNGPILLISHVLFGMVAGGVYEALDDYDLPLTTRTQGGE
jgi:hypothetical protein